MIININFSLYLNEYDSSFISKPWASLDSSHMITSPSSDKNAFASYHEASLHRGGAIIQKNYVPEKRPFLNNLRFVTNDVTIQSRNHQQFQRKFFNINSMKTQFSVSPCLHCCERHFKFWQSGVGKFE